MKIAKVSMLLLRVELKSRHTLGSECNLLFRKGVMGNERSPSSVFTGNWDSVPKYHWEGFMVRHECVCLFHLITLRL